MNIAIVDDLKGEIKLLKEYLQQYGKDKNICFTIESFTNGQDFLSLFRKQYDIVFLDIFLKNSSMTGMDIAEYIRKEDKDCLLIFSTSTADYAAKSFRVRAFDYLVKPYSYRLFQESMELCGNMLSHSRQFIEIKEGRIQIKILLGNILYTDYSNHYILIHTKTKIHKCYMHFSAFQVLLKPYPQFLCCFRNCIINMDEVSSIEDRHFIMTNGDYVPITRSGRGKIIQLFADYQFKKQNRGAF